MRPRLAHSRVALTSLGVFLGVPPAFAVSSGSAFSTVPGRFRTQELTLGSRALGEICESRDRMPDGTVCNPAFLPEVQDSVLLARVFIGNGYAAISNADQFVNKPLTQDFLHSLFTQNNATAVEANAGLAFTTRFFQAEFSPYRVQYASEVHNPNNPVVAVHAEVERAFVFSGGSSLSGVAPGLADFSVGAKVRILERKFVHGTFTLLDVATRSPEDYLPQRKQNAVLVDPSLAWASKQAPWGLRASVGMTSVGYSSGAYDEYPDNPDFVAGVGVEPPVKWGRLRLGLDFVDLMEAPTIEDRVRFGASYRFGLMELMAGVNSSAATIGVSYLLSFIQAGIAYEVAREDLENGKQVTRIATEINVRF